MKIHVRFILYCLAFLLLSSCSQKLIPGTYKNHKSGTVVFAGAEYTFKKDGTFEYRSFTDSSEDGAFSTLGNGTYEAKGKKLFMTYKSTAPEQATVEVTNKPCTYADQLRVTFTFKGPDMHPIPGLEVRALQTSGIPRICITNNSGRAIFDLLNTGEPYQFVAQQMGWQDVIISPLIAQCSDYQVVMVEKVNTVLGGKKENYPLKVEKKTIQLDRGKGWERFYRQ